MATLIPAMNDATAEGGSILETLRKLESGNIVLVFNDCEVIMPGTWSIRKNEFPNGLYEGQRLNAYWDADGRFHLSEA